MVDGAGIRSAPVGVLLETVPDQHQQKKYAQADQFQIGGLVPDDPCVWQADEQAVDAGHGRAFGAKGEQT